MTSHVIERARLAERELARRLRQSSVSRLFGFELEAAEGGRAVLRMRVTAKHKQVHRVVHGGILAALADTAGGLASYTVVPRGTRMATVEMKINYLEAVDRGVLVAEARVLRKGRNFIVVDCDVVDADGRLAAKALMTFSIGPREPKRRR
ncbi:MAG: PaaI family thioesterase [Acidobacteria bacterium]|nr:PaaI family thioesterase [Acidobacteriota bacterium]